MSNEEKLLEVRDIGWVADDGSYGAGNVILFDPTKLTEDEWDALDGLPDSYKVGYVKSILEGK